MKLFQRLLTYVLISIVIFASFGAIFVPKKAQGQNPVRGTRPGDCKTSFDSSLGGSGSYHQCAVTSQNGYFLHLFRGTTTEAGDDTLFKFVASNYFGRTSDIGMWVYQSVDNPNFFTAFKPDGDAVVTTHHYLAGEDNNWNEYANRDPGPLKYHMRSSDSTPDVLYQYEVGTYNGTRVAWRAVANGTVTLNGTPVEKAYMQMTIGSNGPPLIGEDTNGDGIYDFSNVGTNANVWINWFEVPNVGFYVNYEEPGGQKYEKTVTTAIATDWRHHATDARAMLTKVDVNFTKDEKVDVFSREQGGESSTKTELMGDTCGVTGEVTVLAIARVLCALIKGIGALGTWMLDTLFDDTFNAIRNHSSTIAQNLNPLLITQAHAQAGPSKIKEALTSGGGAGGDYAWVFLTWKIVMGLADVFVAVILIFLAVINILHIQYDTYMLKKTLPILIIGVILAHFSIVITKMLIDATNVLTATVTGGESASTMMTKIVNNIVNPSFTSGTTKGIGNLVLDLIFTFVAAVGLLILGFLFYVRYIVILACTVVAPVAFVFMAFAPTQSLFKQWWGWYAKFIFMKPIAFFLVYLAMKVAETGSGSLDIAPWVIATFLIYAAVIVPFKMGGAVTAAWGGLGKRVASRAYAPVGRTVQGAINRELDYRRQTLGGRFNRFLNESTPLGGMRARRRDELKTVEEQLAGSESLASSRQSERHRARHMLRRRRAQEGKENLEAQEAELTNTIEAGERIDALSDWDYRLITRAPGRAGTDNPADIARQYMNASNRINIAKSALEKRRDIDLNISAMRDLRDHRAVTAQMEADVINLHNGIDVEAYDSNGNDRNMTDHLSYGAVIEQAADFRAKAKAAHNPADRARMDGIAHNYEQAARTYRQTNANRYDYDAILDRNTAGRRYKEINPRIMEEADTTYKSSNGQSVVNELNGSHGTAEYRGDAHSADLLLTGQQASNEDTANFATTQQVQAVNMFMTQGVRSGDYEGLQALHGFVNRVGQAHTNLGTAQAGIYKRQQLTNAIANMDPAMGAEMRNILSDRAGLGNNFAALTPAQQTQVFDNADLSQLQVLGPDDANRAQRQFAERVLAGVHQDDNLGLSSNIGAAATRVNPSAHPRT